MFEKVKKYYERGFYSKAQVADFVKKGKLTAEQYEEITGEAYDG
ncbi:MAG: XkdX family protein [Lachnospiraceae bacterium]|nr:XkdX family protein [Lachnospiraceae bacterium]